MIAVSSHRPHSRSVEFARNQSMAKRTWENAFFWIIYAGPKETDLSSPKTEFRKTEDWPRIQTMAQIAASKRGYVAILNADILVDPRIKRLEDFWRKRGYVCASSRRFHFDPFNPKGFADARLIDADRGRDIFVATYDVWQRVAGIIPPYLRIGHQQWDRWLSDYFRDTFSSRFHDFTDNRFIFHPNHGDREMPHAQQIVEGVAA